MISQSDWSEKRRYTRYAVTDTVEIYVAGIEGRFIGFGTLHDLSETGAGIALDVSIAPGTVVELTNGKATLSAVCRHTNCSQTGYVSGFEFINGSQAIAVHNWSPLPATW